jgi:hypothetical protein
MTKFVRQNVLLGIAGLCFIFAGLRDLYRPGFLTLNKEIPSKGQIGIAMGVGLFFIGLAAFRTLNGQQSDKNE